MDCSPLTPDKLSGKTLADIGATQLSAGASVRAADAFAISGSDASRLVFETESGTLDRIGAGMEGGDIVVHGDAGAYLGLGMKSGNVSVDGNCGIFAGAELKGGTISVKGDCGDFAGAALPGNRRGMSGGLLIVRGNAGDRAGDRMRRGAILVAGRCGSFCGSRMIAGTIAVLGAVAHSPGFAMSRGTLLLSSAPKEMLATFSDCGAHNFGFLPLLIQSWRALPGEFGKLEIRHRARRYMGDLANFGKGEILIWE